MTNSSPNKTISTIFVLFLALTGLAGARGLVAQSGPSTSTPYPPATEAERNDTSIPPLVGGIPATPKTAVDVPRGPANPGTLFQASPNAPVITVWYGSSQTFGPNGDPQKWINIVGNVTSAAPLSGLNYSLNGGPTKTLSIGANGSRLINNGDFNIELDYTDLNPGANTVIITATDSMGGSTPAQVSVNYQARAGNWTPGTYVIDWSTASKVNDVAQVIDGNWMINAGKARPVSLAATGFDRLIGVGDMSWREYTVTVPVTVHALDLNKSPAVGLIVRWLGHYDDGKAFQPVVGWKRLGALAWYRYEKATATEGLQLLGDGGKDLAAKGFNLTLGTTYMYKVSITPNADPAKPATYRFKVWPQAQAEPAGWDLESAGVSGEPRNGSIVLLAHHADVSFGNATVVLNSTEPKPELTIATIGTGSGSVIAIPQKTAYRFGEDVTLEAVPDSGSTFVGWEGDVTGTVNPASVEMFADRSVKAQFKNTSLQTPISDDFNGCALDPSLWTFVNPLGDSSVTMTGGHAEISVPAGTTHDLWTTGRNAPRIMQFADDGDFEFVVKFDSAMGTKNQAQGILVEGDAQNYLRYNFLHDGSSYKIQAYTFTNGTPLSRVNNNITMSTPMYLRVKRTGDVWGLYYSSNGTTWSIGAEFTYSLAVSSVGVYAGNSSNANPAHTAKVDYFFNTQTPISPEDNDRKLNITVNGSGTVQRVPDKENYACGEVVTLTAVAADEYEFDSWSGGLVSNNNPAQLTMNTTKNVTANFVTDRDTFIISISTSGGSGIVELDPAKAEYSYGEEVTLTAIPDSGFEFREWSGDLQGSQNPRTITVTKDLQITANFAGEGIYSLTILPSTNGSVSADPVRDLYAQDEQVTLMAVPELGYVFSGWGGDVSGSENPLTITMTQNTTVSAGFINAPPYDLNVTTNGPGSVTLDPEGTQFIAGSIVTLTATAQSGYIFTGWTGDLISNVNPYQLLIDGNKNIVANFGEATDVVSDDFSSCTLKPVWTWVDPLGQADYVLTGTQARIIVPPGANYEIWKNGNKSARLVQDVANTDFEIIVKFASPVTQGVQTQGILIETDDDTFLRADFHHNGTGMRFFAGTVDNGASRNRFNEPITPTASPEIYMRVQRNGDMFRLFYRFTESDPWTGVTGSNFKFPMEVKRAGIFGSAQPLAGQPAPGHTAIFDFFFNTQSPISPEDGNAPGIVAGKVGEGTVTLTPNNGPYTCGQQVQVKATPAAGWRFQNWSGDLTGSNPTQTLTVSKKHNVTATFVRISGYKLFLPVAIR